MTDFFKSNLEILRETHNYSLTKLAERLKLDEASALSLEMGKEEIRPDIILKISRLFHIPCGILLGIDLKKKPSILRSKARKKVMDLNNEFGLTMDADTLYVLDEFNDFSDRDEIERAEDAEAHYMLMYQRMRKVCAGTLLVIDRMINFINSLDYSEEDEYDWTS